jgi:hypothetical protein
MRPRLIPIVAALTACGQTLALTTTRPDPSHEPSPQPEAGASDDAATTPTIEAGSVVDAGVAASTVDADAGEQPDSGENNANCSPIDGPCGGALTCCSGLFCLTANQICVHY